MTSEIHGIIPAMVTPFTADGELNEGALRRLVGTLIDAGVHGLFASGSQGEFWALDAAEKRRLWAIVVQETRGRVPVYAGTAAITTRETIALTRLAAECGVDAVSILTPFFVSPNEQELYEHFRAVAQSTQLPILLYNNPARTGVGISAGLLARLAEIDNIVGIKDSSGDLQATAEYVRRAPANFATLMGRDTLILAGLLYGCAGAIAATGNVVPALVVDIYERFRADDLQGAQRAQDALAPLRLAFTWGTFPVVVKEALDLMGLEAGPARGPIGRLSPERREDLRRVLDEMGAL